MRNRIPSRVSSLLIVSSVLFFMALLLSTNAFGAYLRNVPLTVKQPNGVVVDCFATGDEFFNWLHDAAGYTIIQDPATGYYVYAQKNGDGDLVPSVFPVDSVDPKAMGWARWMLPSARKLQKIRDAFYANQPPDVFQPAPKTGTINNIVIFIRFSGESEFTDTISSYDTMFNAATSGANSMANYFKEVSYNTLSVSTTFYPTPGTTVVSYQDANPRNYYQPYNAATNPTGYQGGDNGSERTTREHTLLKNAVNAVSSQVPSGLAVDGDGDGRVDNVCFIVSGSATGWASLLWPHQWSLYSQTAYINSKQVYTYNFQLQTFLQSSGVGVLCHEMFHSLGSPDLYHYSYDGLQPVYAWDIMENNANPPQHMGAFMKYRYGTWISSIPEITSGGTYTLNPLTSSTNNCYKIRSPNSSSEYYVVEYRRKTGTFESAVPGSGLLVYRINTARDGQGNSNGPPDEVYIYRPNGTVSANGNPESAHFSSDVSRTAINDSTNPSGFLSTGSLGGLQISSVTAAGTTISFTISVVVVAPPTVTTGSVTAITQTTATGGGNVTSAGGGTVTERGFCWGTSANPTIAGSHTHDGTGTGSFTSSLTGLVPGSSYHGRAYASNAGGTAYGDDVPFTTTAAISIPQAVDNLALTFAAGGNASWFGQSANYYFGGDAAQSGLIGHSQTSSMETTVTGPITLSFYWKVSSESGYDYLRFYIDSVEQAGSISGEVGWTQKTFSIPTGSHVLKWAYTKDVSVVGGSDAGWVDKVNSGLGNPSATDDFNRHLDGPGSVLPELGHGRVEPAGEPGIEDHGGRPGRRRNRRSGRHLAVAKRGLGEVQPDRDVGESRHDGRLDRRRGHERRRPGRAAGQLDGPGRLSGAIIPPAHGPSCRRRPRRSRPAIWTATARTT